MYDADSGKPVDTKSCTRRSGGAAAIAAFLMCAYGFGALSAPDPTSLFTWCNLVFYYTLRLGGVAFAVVALWCWIGHVAALAGSGVLSLLVGVSFLLTGVGMLVDGGTMINSVIITVVGWSFAVAGRRDLRTYLYLGAHSDPTDQGERWRSERTPTSNATHEASSEPPLADTLAGQLKARTAAPPSDTPTSRRSSPPMAQDNTPALPPDPASETPVPAREPRATPEGGFLADLAKNGRPPGV